MASQAGIHIKLNVRFGSKADIAPWILMSALPPNSGHQAAGLRCPLCAKTCREQVQQSHDYSITSSAATSSPDGTVRPSALAALRLIAVW